MTLSAILNAQKKLYLEACGPYGGTAKGFRERIKADYRAHELKYTALVLDAVMEASTKNWQAPPRKRGPDLFCISGLTIPETLTRPSSFATGEGIDDDDEDKFEKVDCKYATVSDLIDDATIKLRKAAQSSAAAEAQMKAADEARRRARGKVTTFLHEIADPPPVSPKPHAEREPAI
ncbi:hypothetical protein HAP41_0000020710 [Bradyrhizobium barranii subsp. apii]|uniref:Uncharacterized protein n=1 Tax=Bradyrhizobium barranii subsp. apii TaxID=2819348 RepID=A0A8T5VN28_9BRAD|nr:hypothetical protein [Bradyrhizobium barranii]UPT91132.1 hypothetical protein HAP41_0000020710 [Bradyrhizobium barranii subsp. apii]UPT99242.1 hypothetical protein J4G48_0014835 [Bradyrhizobium barranii subsp. apii]